MTPKVAPDPALKGARARPTIRDVARAAGVSPATVSNVLGGVKPVRAASAERVRAAARALGYEVDRAASQLRSGRARIVAVLVPSLENPFFTSIVAAVERHVREDGYELVVASSNDDEATEQARLRALLSWRPSGMVMVPCADGFTNAEWLARTPHVVIDRVGGATDVDTVAVDNAQAGEVAAGHLMELGHERILIVASSLMLANIRMRCAGINAALEAAGRPAAQVLEIGLDAAAAAERLEAWLKLQERPTAVIALTNFATLAVLAALAQFSVRIPLDMSLVGFDDYAWMRAAAPSITAIRQPVGDMGRLAWESLKRRIEEPHTPPHCHSLPCELVVRASTGRSAAAGPRERSRVVAAGKAGSGAARGRPSAAG